MQHRVLIAADVGVHRQPLRGYAGIERPVIKLGRRVAQEVPPGIEECVRNVRLPSPQFAALRTGHPIPLLVAGEGRDSTLVRAKIF